MNRKHDRAGGSARRLSLGLLLSVAVAVPAPVRAGSWSEGWSGRLTLYGWLTAADGDISARNRDAAAPVSLDISDVLDRVNLAFFGKAEIRRARVGLLVDGIYVDLSSSQTGPGPLAAQIDGDTDLVMLTGALAYRAYESDQVSLDPYLGVRFVSTDVSLRARGQLPVPFDITAGADESWVDPVLGLSARGKLTDRISLVGIADVGGFGAGSELTWQVYAGGTYAITRRVDAELGFRAMSIDYDTDRFEFDAQIFGPVLGVSVNF